MNKQPKSDRFWEKFFIPTLVLIISTITIAVILNYLQIDKEGRDLNNTRTESEERYVEHYRKDTMLDQQPVLSGENERNKLDVDSGINSKMTSVEEKQKPETAVKEKSEEFNYLFQGRIEDDNYVKEKIVIKCGNCKSYKVSNVDKYGNFDLDYNLFEVSDISQVKVEFYYDSKLIHRENIPYVQRAKKITFE